MNTLFTAGSLILGIGVVVVFLLHTVRKMMFFSWRDFIPSRVETPKNNLVSRPIPNGTIIGDMEYFDYIAESIAREQSRDERAR